MITLTGKKISEGIAIGKLTFYKRDIKEIKRIYVKDVEKEIQRYKKAREKAIAELELVYDLSVREVGEADAKGTPGESGIYRFYHEADPGRKTQRRIYCSDICRTVDPYQ